MAIRERMSEKVLVTCHWRNTIHRPLDDQVKSICPSQFMVIGVCLLQTCIHRALVSHVHVPMAMSAPHISVVHVRMIHCSKANDQGQNCGRKFTL